jgi:hypothetical protein
VALKLEISEVLNKLYFLLLVFLVFEDSFAIAKEDEFLN